MPRYSPDASSAISTHPSPSSPSPRRPQHVVLETAPLIPLHFPRCIPRRTTLRKLVRVSRDQWWLCCDLVVVVEHERDLIAIWFGAFFSSSGGDSGGGSRDGDGGGCFAVDCGRRWCESSESKAL
ncbi:hypothetical protein Droror1_Dr00014284 [Drosera rotundifolia]